MSSLPTLATSSKTLRAKLIRAHVQAAGYAGVVCFSCGNASAALAALGLQLLDVSPRGSLVPTRWWTPAEIRAAWPHLFDATSGHLPAWMMAALAEALHAELGKLHDSAYLVPTGSGETVMCLRWAYPSTEFVAVYDDARQATRYHAEAPLARLVAATGPCWRTPAG